MIIKNFQNWLDSLLSRCFGKKKFSRTFFTKTLKEGDALCLRVPEGVPDGVLDGFSNIFKKYDCIDLAYIAYGFVSKDDQEPHYIIGIKFAKDANVTTTQLMERMSPEISPIIPKGFYVDMLYFREEKTPFADFMRDYLIPFYSRDFK